MFLWIQMQSAEPECIQVSKIKCLTWMAYICQHTDDSPRFQNIHGGLDSSHRGSRLADDAAVSAGQKAQVEAHEPCCLDMLLHMWPAHIHPATRCVQASHIIVT